jgi:hypothetical protein
LNEGEDFVGREAQDAGLGDEAAGVFGEVGLFAFKLARSGEVGDEGAVAVAEFEDAFGSEAFVGTEDGILVDGEIASELADGGEAVAGAQVTGGTAGADLVDDLAGDRDAGGCFDADKHVGGLASDYTCITVVT